MSDVDCTPGREPHSVVASLVERLCGGDAALCQITLTTCFVLIYLRVCENASVTVHVIQELSLAYGEDLMQSGQCLEAGLILSRAGKCERALTAFEDCLEWRHAVTVATQLNFSDLQFNLLAKRLASE